MTPVSKAIESIFARQEQRHAWLAPAAEQIIRWKAEDQADGILWDEDLPFVERIAPGEVL